MQEFISFLEGKQKVTFAAQRQTVPGTSSGWMRFVFTKDQLAQVSFCSLCCYHWAFGESLFKCFGLTLTMPQGVKVSDLSILNQRLLGGSRSPWGQPVGDSIDCNSHWEGKIQDIEAGGWAITVLVTIVYDSSFPSTSCYNWYWGSQVLLIFCLRMALCSINWKSDTLMSHNIKLMGVKVRQYREKLPGHGREKEILTLEFDWSLSSTENHSTMNILLWRLPPQSTLTHTHTHTFPMLRQSLILNWLWTPFVVEDKLKFLILRPPPRVLGLQSCAAIHSFDTGGSTQSFVHARQAFYQLSHIPIEQ